MTSITPRLNRTHQSHDGTYPLVIQILRHRRKREIYTPYRLYEEEFDSKNCLAIHSFLHPRRSALITEINRYLHDRLTELHLLCRSLLSSRGEACTAAEIADTFRHRADMARFFVYADSHVACLHSEGREGTADNYVNACRALENYLGSRSLSFDRFTSALVDDFAGYLKSRGCMPGTIVFYLRQLRAIYNKALKAQVIRQDLAPFRNQALTEPKTRKRAVTRKEVQRIEKAGLKGVHPEVSLARDLFMFSFYACGMSFVDMCYLTRENIRGQYLCYKRRKTSQPLRILLEKPLRELLARYADPASPYLLPMLRGGDGYKDYKNARNRLGKRIRELGSRLCLKEPLTFYVARHTWATLARDAGVDISVISSSLGHTSEKTTRIYLAGMDRRRLDNANRKVIKLLEMSGVGG